MKKWQFAENEASLVPRAAIMAVVTFFFRFMAYTSRSMGVRFAA